MIQLTRTNRYLLSILSGILMFISFPFTGSLTPFVFISWIPLLMVESNVFTKKYRSSKVYIHAFLSFFIYNLGATWWIWNASAGGAVFAIVLNALIMALVFYWSHLLKKRYTGKIGYVFLIVGWISFEYIHYYWELSYPWLTIGNVFSITPSLVQWYSFTGVLGGSLWVLLVNVLLFFIGSNIYIKKQNWKTEIKTISVLGLIILIPIFYSVITYLNYKEKKDPVEVVALQPNVDPYNEKFSTNLKVQLDKMFVEADKIISPNTQFILAPETAISASFYEGELTELPFYQYILERKKKWYNASFYVGASTLKVFDRKHSSASRKLEGGPGFYESYNTSLLIDEFNTSSFVHKSKLVLGVEKIPFLTLIPWLGDMAIDLDGASGSLGIEQEPRVLKANESVFAPIICYESIYGEFIASQVSKGAEAIFVITNDGWWGDTPGYKQHASFSQLRAIENRRDVVRSANTGISCFINQRGDLEQKTKWWTQTAIKGIINKNKELTFYSRFGDVIGKLACVIFLIMFVYQFVERIQKRMSKK